MQVDGYFPDTSTTNSNHGGKHDAQFVLRLPDRWNGGLVITGAPGTREQYANDFLISDWVLAQGYAFASTDKGNSGLSFYADGEEPGDAVVEWHERVTELTRAAKGAVKDRYGSNPRTTYMAGISNGGYLTRWQLENNPQLFDDPACPGPAVTGTTPAEIVAPCASDASYDYASRPQAVKDAVARVSLTGKIKRPLLTLHGTDDALLPISTDSDVYDEMVADHKRERLHRYYVVEGGNHVDSLVARDPDYLRPMLPCFRSAFSALDRWVTTRTAPPADGMIVRADGPADHPALRDTCALP